MTTATKAKTIPAVKKIAMPLKTTLPKNPAIKNTSMKVAAKVVPNSQITLPKIEVVAEKAITIVKPIKAKKIKLVRDSYTIPKPEYLMFENLKLRAADLKHPVKKSELIRAGIKALEAMNNANFLIALKAVPILKSGRPSK